MRVTYFLAIVLMTSSLSGQSLHQTLDDVSERLDRLDSIVDSRRFVERELNYTDFELRTVNKESDISKSRAYVVVKSFDKQSFEKYLDEINKRYPKERFEYVNHQNSKWVWIISNSEYSYETIGHAVYLFRKEGYGNAWSLFLTENFLYRR